MGRRVPESMGARVELSPAISEAARRDDPPMPAIRIEIEGVVQGVGLRPWICRTARRLGLCGTVVNTSSGVTVDAFGSSGGLDALISALKSDLPPAAHLDGLRVVALDGPAPRDFSIVASVEAEQNRPSIPADLAMCPACRREVDDPADRRSGYAFTHCTECGPRHSIVTGLPYDRARTSMAAFDSCEKCSREYRDPHDRRFHAQAIACPSCGPRVWLEAPFGDRCRVENPVAEAARRIIAGETIAIQGLGGFHLACDATNTEAVARLRERKQRDEKPFAVMVADLEMAEALAEIDEAARRALTSAEHPIVLLRARAANIAWNVAPGSTRLGIFLPYTPLHHLLLRELARPIVLTSGNSSGEPIAFSRDDARRTLVSLADGFLLHDRPIVRRVEDSVVVARPDRRQVLRRARGYAPRPIPLPHFASEPILAVGGHLKNTACLVVEDRAYLTSHLGDLESYEAECAFREDVESFERLLGVRARVLAHDLHPDYASTRYALERGDGMPFGVQHHRAHVLAAVAEHRVEGPVVAAVFDGSGFGTDGTAWGGEILQVDGLSWKRPFSTRPLLLAGGERGIREVWRIAWALLLDAFGPEANRVASALALFADVSSGSRALVDRMLSQRVNVARVRGIGRYFDAFGALCLGFTCATFEGQVAMAWEEAAAAETGEPYPFAMPSVPSETLDVTPENELDLRPTTRAVVSDLLAGKSPALISARFHATLIEAAARMLELAGAERATIVLSGGCFQNQLLDIGLRDRLGSFRVAPPGEVPVNDGGIALGQAWAAVLALRTGAV